MSFPSSSSSAAIGAAREAARDTGRAARSGPGVYPVIWRLHFYAGLLCVPFVLWLALTGSLYLFKPQIDRWVDRRFDALAVDGPAAPPSAQVQAALGAVEGSVLNAYEMPSGPNAAVRVLVGRGRELYRVYVHPRTLEILKVVPEEARLTRLLFYLHGEFLIGRPGSMMVELAGSWAVVMILTGYYLWWPRGGRGLAGLVYPRLTARGRPLWRDLHAVAGFWVSAFTLFLLVSGLPWAASWGGMLKDVRQMAARHEVRQDWTTGSESEVAERIAANTQQHAGHQGHAGHQAPGSAVGMTDGLYRDLDRLVPVVAPLKLAAPALIAPPSALSGSWTARSEAQNRPLRETMTLDGATGAITSRTTFAQWPFIDRLVGYGVALHEGQMLGWFNQALGLFTALGLIVVSVSGYVMWWRRRPAGRLGAPPSARGLRSAPLLLAGIAVLGIVLPLLGASLLVVLAFDLWLLPRLPRLARYLGATGRAA